MTVRAIAVLVETDSRRRLFDAEAGDEVEKIAAGRHERFERTTGRRGGPRLGVGRHHRPAHLPGDFSPAASARSRSVSPALVRPGDVISCRGKVLEKRPAKDGADPHEVPEIEIELWAENQKGEKVVTGRATVTVPSRG